MKRSRFRSSALVAPLAACAVLVAVPAAQARTQHRGASVHGVMMHVHRADLALSDVVSGRTGELSLIRGQGAAALTEAGTLAHQARGTAAKSRAAHVLTSVSNQFGRDTHQLGGVLAQEPASVQSEVATTIAGATYGQQIAASLIAQLLPLVPGAAQGPLTQVLASLPSQDATQATQLAGVLNAGSIACEATGAVQQALALATQAVNTGLSAAQAALASAPANIRGQLQPLLDGLPTQLAGIEKLVLGLIPCSSTGGSGGGNGSTILPIDPTSFVSGITGLISGILHQVLPFGLGQGQGSAPAPVPGVLGGLLGSISGLLGGLIPAGLIPSGLIPGGLF